MTIYLNAELRITYTTYTHMCTFQGAFCDLAEFCTHVLQISYISFACCRRVSRKFG